MNMISISSKEITLFELIVGCLIVIFSLINIGIYIRQKKRFSIKYDLLRDPTFRGRKWLQNLIYVMYYIQLLMPIFLMVVLFIEIVIRQVSSGFTVLFNGMLLISLCYLTNPTTFYIKIGIVLFLLVVAELLVLYLSEKTKDVMYSASSAIYFSLNGILVLLAIYANQNIYWDISQVFNIKEIQEKVFQINQDWVSKLPKIVNGGLYGWFNNKNNKIQNKQDTYIENGTNQHNSNQQNETCCINCCSNKCRGNQSLWFIIFYTLSLATLIIYAFQNWWFAKQWIGTITSGVVITFDFVIFVLSSLSTETRSPFSVMCIIFVIRFFLFVFGNSYWFMGCCILYIIIGTFITYLIIQKRFPKYKVQQKQQSINALKTPQFMFILITTQFVIMIIALFVSTDKVSSTESFIINDFEFQVWSLGVISIFITFIFAFYITTSRVLYRSLNKIQDKVVYYFFDQAFTEYHMYLLVNYALIVGLGIFTYFKYSTSLSLTLCIFLPLIFQTLVQMGISWKNNNYQILGDKQQNRKYQQNKRRNQEKRRSIMAKSQNYNQIVNHMAFQLYQKNQNKEENQKKQLDVIKEDDHDSSSHEVVPNKVQFEKSQSQDDLMFQNITLTKNDKRLLISIALFLLCNTGMIITSYLWCKSPVGLYIFLTLFSYILQFPYFRCIKTVHDLSALQLITIIVGYLTGLVFWSFFWYETGGCFAWSSIFIILLSYLLVQTLQHDKDQKKAYITQIVQILLLMVFDVVIIWLEYQQKLYVIIACGVIFYFILGLTFYYFFTLYNKSLPQWVYYSLAGIIGATFIAIIITTFFIKSISIFVTFSIAVLLPIGGVVAFGLSQFYYRYYRRFDDVVIYSAYGLPAMRFISEKEVLKKDELYLYLYFIGLMGLVVYAEVTFFFFDQHTNAGIYSLCCFQVISFCSLCLIVMKNYYEIGKNKDQITKQMLIETLTVLLQKYMPSIDDDINTGKKKDKLQQLEKQVENNPDDQNINLIYQEIVDKHDDIMLNEEQQELFLFFWIGLIEFRIITKKKQTMNHLINTIKQIKTELEEKGIVFDDDGYNDDLEIRYQKIQNQIHGLDPMKHLIFKKIIEEHQEKKKEEKKKQDNIDKKQNNKNQQRDKQFELKTADISKINDLDASGNIKEGYTMTPEDKIIISQFKKMVKDLKDNKLLFQDQQFNANGNSLGAKVINSVQKWQRPGQKCQIFKEDFSSKDIKQGRVGDCYLISTLGVLGDKIIKKALGMPYINQKGQQVLEKWPSKLDQGAFMVRFKKSRKNVFVKIDSRFPVDKFGKWVCGKCQDEEQIWVNIIQKAYAKMYGSYTNIFGGKAHFVMAQFTGGFPSQILLEQYAHNSNALWKKLESFKSNRYIMAAGSPPGSDTSYSPLGIAKGHAYAILDIMAVDSFKLIKFKNPQGKNSMQWKGDFSDKSPQMNNRMKGLLNHNSQSDGIFWMPLVNFISQFKSLYVCRQFSKEEWPKKCLNGEWKMGINSFGSEKEKNIECNPQYGITITQKCTLFISITQERDNDKYTSTGKIKMGFRLQRNNGKRISKENISSSSLCTPSVAPTSNISLTNQYELEEATYPYTYTLMVYPQKRDDEGKYLVEVYCNDTKWSVIEDAVFDEVKRLQSQSHIITKQ